MQLIDGRVTERASSNATLNIIIVQNFVKIIFISLLINKNSLTISKIVLTITQVKDKFLFLRNNTS